MTLIKLVKQVLLKGSKNWHCSGQLRTSNRHRKAPTSKYLVDIN